MEYRLQLAGWQAAVVGALILGVVTYQCVSRIQTVDESGRQTLRAWLVKEHQGKGLRQQVQAYLKRKAGEEPEPAAPVTSEPSVRFVSLAAHGSAEIMVVGLQVWSTTARRPTVAPYATSTSIAGRTGAGMVFADIDAVHY